VPWKSFFHTKLHGGGFCPLPWIVRLNLTTRLIKSVTATFVIVLAMLCTGCSLFFAKPGGTSLPSKSGDTPSPTSSIGASPAGPISTPTHSVAPAQQAVYKPKANEYVSLRKSPELNSDTIERINVGERMVCLGFDGIFMYVKVEKTGSKGYVHGGFVERVSADETLKALSVVPTGSSKYTYDRLQSDLKTLKSKYSDLLELKTLAKTADGRDITLCIIGDKDAKHKVFVSAAIHGREHMTALLAAKQIEQQLYQMKNGQWQQKEVAFYVIPMLNPDGVTISQQGASAIRSSTLRSKVQQILSIENMQPDLWKANARGVDLNRNFDAAWETLQDDGPSSLRYRGEAPFSETETKAVRDLMKSTHFDATLSYHSTGSVLYWQYTASDALLTRNEALAKKLGDLTGYPMASADDEEELEGGGLKDWALEELSVPSITAEIGCLDAPLPAHEFAALWQRNAGVFKILADFALSGK